jgi:hypothetical protein
MHSLLLLNFPPVDPIQRVEVNQGHQVTPMLALKGGWDTCSL